MVNIILKGQPISTNNCYYHAGKGLTFITLKSKILKDDYKWQAKQQYKGQIITEDVEVTIKIYFGTKRKVDWDNYHKLSMDALNGIVWEDDSQISVAHIYKDYDKSNPRIEIVIHS